MSVPKNLENAPVQVLTQLHHENCIYIYEEEIRVDVIKHSF